MEERKEPVERPSLLWRAEAVEERRIEDELRQQVRYFQGSNKLGLFTTFESIWTI